MRFLGSRCRNWAGEIQKRRLLRAQSPQEIARADWSDSLRDPSSFYRNCFLYFHKALPAELRRHRDYFRKDGRGFGEDAFHTMWFLLFREFQPRTFLEIGVFRGQTVSLAGLLQRHFNHPGEVAGISPFLPAGDSVSKYQANIDYLEDTLANCAYFSLPKPELVKAFSTDPTARQFIAARQWDCIYIDGNHDVEVVRQDWECCARQVQPGGIIVLDDAGLTTAYRPPLFATGGHPGPSRMAQEIPRDQFAEILQVGHNRVFQRIS